MQVKRMRSDIEIVYIRPALMRNASAPVFLLLAKRGRGSAMRVFIGKAGYNNLIGENKIL